MKLQPSKFSLLLTKDILCFAWPLLIGYIHTRAMYFIAVILAVAVRGLTGWMARTEGTFSPQQRHWLAATSIAGYSLWILSLIWAGITLESPPVWALISLVIPVLGVAAFTVIRINLGKEPSNWGKIPSPSDVAPLEKPPLRELRRP